MKLIKAIVVVVSIGILFFGNIGINVFKHICQKEGVTISYFVESDHHCKTEQKVEKSCCAEKISENCCDDIVEFYQLKLDYVDQLLDVSFDFFHVEQTLCSNYSVSFGDEIVYSNYAQPPPLSGRNILIKNQTFII